MNRRLFFMFLTTLAKTPKWELRQVIPQINVVNAFKSSVKNKSKGSSTTVPTWKLSVTKKAEPETPSAPAIEIIKIEESECFKKKQEDAQREDCQRRKRQEEDEDSDTEEDLPRKIMHSASQARIVGGHSRLLYIELNDMAKGAKPEEAKKLGEEI